MQGMGLSWNYEIYSFFIAPCNGLQGAVTQYAANPARNYGANPFSFRQVHWVILHVRALHNAQDQRLYVPFDSSKDKAMVKCLA